MAQLCLKATCKRKSVATCHCCKENLCLYHLKEHQDLLISQLNPLADRINALGVRLKAFNVKQASANCHQNLDEWRDTCHTMIDRLYEQKCQELDQCVTEKIEKQQDDIGQIQSRVTEMICEQETTRTDIGFLTTTIRDLEKEMNNIEEVFIKVEIRSLIIDDSFIRIIGSNIGQLDLSTLSSPYKTIDCHKENSEALASNTRFLLIHKEANLCLIDKELTVVKQNAWSHSKIYGMCWSRTLARFIVSSGENIFFIDERTLLTEKVQINENQKWGSCTCSDTKLYITVWETGSSIREYTLSPSIQLAKQWQSPTTCLQQEMIHDINYNNDTLALLIKDKSSKTINMELRSAKTLERLWLCQLNIKSSHMFKFHCCSLNHNGWFVIDYENQQLLHIKTDGKVKGIHAYNPQPRCAVLFGPHIVAVSTEKSINFHKV